MSKSLIKVENVSKKFCKDLKRSLWYGIKDLGSELLGISHNNDVQLRKDEFWALKDVSFELKRGECLGLIGKNGAGKTTLLRILNGLIKPDKGRIEMHGRVGALIALGAGFNPILTGLENIYVNASVLGLTKKEIDAKFDEIVEFAELGEFINSPIQSYSSGMIVRLAFSIAVSMEPEILIVDEALAVGDMEFKERAITRIKQMRENGMSIILVSHSIPMVRNICRHAIWLDHGKIILINKAEDVCIAYQEYLENHSIFYYSLISRGLNYQNSTRIYHNSGHKKTIAINSVDVSNNRICVFGELRINFYLNINRPDKLKNGFGLGIIIHNTTGDTVAIFNTIRDNIYLTDADENISLHLPCISFAPGKYWISANACDNNILFSYDIFDHCASFEVLQEYNLDGIPRWEGQLACNHEWKSSFKIL